MGEDRYRGQTLEAVASCTRVEEGDAFRHFTPSASKAALANTVCSIITIPRAEHLSEKERADVYDRAKFVSCRARYLGCIADLQLENCIIKVR